MLYCLQGDKSTDSANIEDGLYLVLHFDPNPADRDSSCTHATNFFTV